MHVFNGVVQIGPPKPLPLPFYYLRPMLRILVVALFLGMFLQLPAQSGSNPFDLKFRPSKPIPSASPIRSPKDSIASIHTPSSVTVSPQTETKTYEDTSIINLGSPADTNNKSANPFDIKPTGDSSITETKTVIKADSAETEIKPILPPSLVRSSSKGFQIFFLLLSLLFLIFIVNVERNYVRDLWRVISNENYSSLHHRNQRNTMRQILLMMGYAVFIFQAGIFIYHALRIFHYNGPIQMNIWIPMLIISGIYLVRHSVIRYLRWLFNNQKEMTLFGFDISIFNTMVGLILLPINVLLLFGPESISKPLIIIGIITFIAAYGLRQLRWMLTARRLIAHSLFLFFVYLCAVEILPLWALSRFIW